MITATSGRQYAGRSNKSVVAKRDGIAESGIAGIVTVDRSQFRHCGPKHWPSRSPEKLSVDNFSRGYGRIPLEIITMRFAARRPNWQGISGFSCNRFRGPLHDFCRWQ
jgi:hypothetical protein